MRNSQEGGLKMRMKSDGFTALEVFMVVLLISILAAIVIPRYSITTKVAKVQACEMQRSIINKQIEQYYYVEATWPADDLSDIKANARYFPDGMPTCPVDETSYRMSESSDTLPPPLHRITSHREGDSTHFFK